MLFFTAQGLKRVPKGLFSVWNWLSVSFTEISVAKQDPIENKESEI
jgi:hypothetical protein